MIKVLAVPFVIGSMILTPLLGLYYILAYNINLKKIKGLESKLKREQKNHQLTKQMLDELMD